MIATVLAGLLAVLMAAAIGFSVWMFLMLGLSMLHETISESAARFITRCGCPACSAWREHHGRQLTAMRWGWFRGVK